MLDPDWSADVGMGLHEFRDWTLTEGFSADPKMVVSHVRGRPLE